MSRSGTPTPSGRLLAKPPTPAYPARSPPPPVSLTSPTSRVRPPLSSPLLSPAVLDLPGPAARRTPSPQLLTIPQSETAEYALLTPAETAARLHTSVSGGLGAAEAVTRLAQHGANELPREVPEPLWLRFVKQFRETLILLLLGSAAVSFIMGNLDDAISISLAVFIVVTVAFVQEYRSEKSLEALNSLVPNFAHVLRRGGTDVAARVGKHANGHIEMHSMESQALLDDDESESTKIPAAELVPGDLVVFSTGDRIPADIRITHAAELSIDESNLTGENEAVTKSPEKLVRLTSPQAPFYASPATGTVGVDVRLNDQHNIAFMGTLVRSGNGRGIVIGTGGKTEFGAISESLAEIESPRTPLQLSMDRLGKELSYMSFGVIGFILLIGLLRGWKLLDTFQVGVSLAVAAIPEGLPIIVTVTLALGVLRMSGRRAIVRRLPSVETLGSVNVVCSDKTGTLTTNHITVTKLWHFGDSNPVPVGKLHGSKDVDSATKRIMRIGNIVNNGRLQAGEGSNANTASILLSTVGDDPTLARSRWVGQPTDVALLDLLDSFDESDVRNHIGSRLLETPFSSERKWMGVVVKGGEAGSDVSYIKGALEQVLRRCDTYIDTDGREIVLDQTRRKEIEAAANSMADEGLRVLGFASGAAQHKPLRESQSGRSTPLSQVKSEAESSTSRAEDAYYGLAFAGLVGMNDPPRRGVDRSIRKLMAGGVRVVMVTGDAEATAVAIARQLGMPVHSAASVLRGDQVEAMSARDLEQAVATATIFARTSPEHKLKIVRAFQARGDLVAMTGDGVNDAPALKKADIGIAMGRHGTDVAKEAADMILMDDDFSTILSAIEEGKGIFYNIQNFLTFQLSTSAAALSLVFLSTLLGYKNPLNPMQILWINILMDGPPAQSLGVEPVDPAVMTRPPRRKQAPVLTRALLRRVLICAACITAGTLSTYVHALSADASYATSSSPFDGAATAAAAVVAGPRRGGVHAEGPAAGPLLGARSLPAGPQPAPAPGGAPSARATTLTFTAFVLFDMFNALTCRSATKSVLRGQVRLLSGNRMFNAAVAASLAAQAAVVHVPALQRVFQTEALGWGDWAGLAALASLVLWVDEACKWWNGRKAGGARGYSDNV